MLSQEEDIAYGKKSEMNLHKTIESLVGDTVEWKGGFEIFDYSNKGRTIWVELKTRRIKHDDYPTAIIGSNKLELCKKTEGVEYYFVYNYLDGIYYIKYDKAVFDTFEVNPEYRRGERFGCTNSPSSVVFIPTGLLKRYEPKQD